MFDLGILSRKLPNPIDLPALAAIRRKRLLHARRLRRDIEPDVAHKNRAALIFFLIEKLTSIPVKTADYGRQGKIPIINIDEMDALLMRGRVVKAQLLLLDVKLLVGARN